MKYIRVGLKKCMVKVITDENVEQWMDIVGNDKFSSEAVKKSLATTFKEGDDIKLDYVQSGQDYQVKAIIYGDKPVQSSKDNNKQTTGKVTSKPEFKSTSRNTGQSIELQNCGRNTAEVIKALTGRVDENNVLDLIDKIFDKFKEKIQG